MRENRDQNRRENLAEAIYSFNQETDSIYHDTSDLRQDDIMMRDFSPLITKSFLNGVSMLSTSIILQPFITTGIIAQTQKVKGEGKTYQQIFKHSIFPLSVGEFYKESQIIFKRRASSSIAIAAASTSTNSIFEFGAFGLTFCNASLETIIASTKTPEASERFNATQRKNFPLIDHAKIGVDLTKPLTAKEFFKLCQNSTKTQKFTIEDYQKLCDKQKIYQANFYYQISSLYMRNIISSSAIFLAKSIADKYINNHREEIIESGININHASLALTLFARTSLAYLTTPLDLIFTLYSSGDKTATDCKKFIQTELKKGGKNLFNGALSRTSLSFLTANSIAFGMILSDYIQSQAQEINSRKTEDLTLIESFLNFLHESLLTAKPRKNSTTIKQEEPQQEPPQKFTEQLSNKTTEKGR